MSLRQTLLGRFITGVIGSSVVTALAVRTFWLPIWPTPLIPRERVVTILAAVGQVLVAFFVVAMATWGSAEETATRQKLELDAKSAASVLTEAEIKRRREQLKIQLKLPNAPPVAGTDDILRRIEKVTANSSLEAAEEELYRLGSVRRDLEAIRFPNDAHARYLDECRGMTRRLEQAALSRVLALRSRELTMRTHRLHTSFAWLFGFSFANCIICFWPDTLFADRLWSGGNEVLGKSLPTGVASSVLILILSEIFGLGYWFVQSLILVHASLARETGH